MDEDILESGEQEVIVDETEQPVMDNQAFTEYVAFYDEFWTKRVESFENALMIQVIGLAVIAGCLMAILVLKFFHKG